MSEPIAGYQPCDIEEWWDPYTTVQTYQKGENEEDLAVLWTTRCEVCRSVLSKTLRKPGPRSYPGERIAGITLPETCMCEIEDEFTDEWL